MDISGRYLGFTDISVSAKMTDIISLVRCWQNAVIFIPHTFRQLAQESTTKQVKTVSCSNANRFVFL